MKTSFLIILLTVFFSAYSQDDRSLFKTPFVVFEGCNNDETAEKCYEIKLQEFISKNLDSKTLEEVTKDSSRKEDTIVINTTIRYGKQGYIVPMNSSARTPYISLDIIINNLIQQKIPRVKPVINASGDTLATTVKKKIGFVLDTSNHRLIPLKDYDSTPKEFAFNNVDKIPVYNGCDENSSKNVLTHCINKKISQLISENFNLNLASTLKLSPGKKRITLQFKISKTGNLIDINARGPHPELEKEAKRVIRLVPKFLKPGYFEDKPVDVSFSMPIVFKVTD
ncbi:energy transducer TonB [Psychroserpens sp.]|uniref:energy transducer TonB family protein n=1 Tax=Psychroserpens sp. TaxID=2020870 RepID=UPI00385B02CD